MNCQLVKRLFWVMTPVEDNTVKDEGVAGAIVNHKVSDYAKWKRVKRAYDDDASARREGGVIGAAVNRSAEDPNMVSVYLQAKDLASLKSLTSSEEMKKKMMDAGVEGVPQVTFWTGGEWG